VELAEIERRLKERLLCYVEGTEVGQNLGGVMKNWVYRANEIRSLMAKKYM